MECGVYFENFVMIGLKADAGDNFKNRASIPLAPYGLLFSFVNYLHEPGDVFIQYFGFFLLDLVNVRKKNCAF